MAAAKNVDAKVRKLREDALKLVSETKFEKALDLYDQLIKLDPEEGEWPRRAADCHWHLQRPDQRLRYSALAARVYSEAGLLLKAIAMCKVALSIDPHHAQSLEQLAQLHARRPQAPERAQPEGVRRIDAVEKVRQAGAARMPLAGRRRSLRPSANAEEEAQREEKLRARRAAAAALRQARTDRRRADVAANQARRQQTAASAETAEKKPEERVFAPEARRHERSEAAAAPAPVKVAPVAKDQGTHASERILGRIALKPAKVTMLEPPSLGPPGPPSSAFPPGQTHHIPSLIMNEVRASKPPGPALETLLLSIRVPAEARVSLLPTKGNVYSLTLNDVPSAELRAARIPTIAAPPAIESIAPGVAIIDPESDPPPPISSGKPENIGLYSGLSTDRLAVAARSFSDIPLLSELPPEVLRQLITDVAMVELTPGEVLFEEGDLADAMYVVVEGSVVAVALPHGEKPVELAVVEEGEFFGEIGLLSDQPRQATVRAREATRLLRFDRDIVAVLVDLEPGFLSTLLHFLRERLVEDLMSSSPLFTPFNEDERYELAEQFEFLEIEPNSVLIQRGQVSIGMYVLLTGEAHLTGASDAGTLRKLGPGDIFGEQALLNNEHSRIDVRAATKCFALCLPADAFPEVIMTHPTVLEYLSTLNESSKGELDVAADFLDHIKFF